MTSEPLRRTLHAGTGALLLIGVVGDWQLFRIVVHSLAAIGIGAEVWRLRDARFRAFLANAIPVFRSRESNRTVGAVWLIVGYALASWFPAPGPAAGILTAALADPAASLVGSRWGGGAHKTWAGTAAAALTSVIVLVAIGLPAAVAVVGALTAAFLERIAGAVDDNLLIAPGVAAVTWWFG